MTHMLFRDAPYQREAESKVTAHTPEGGLILEASLFYPTGGGQPGDCGRLQWNGNSISIATAIKGEGSDIVLVPSEPRALPQIGASVLQDLDWDRRHSHMRVHTALHLLSVALPFGVTGGAIGAGRGRLDFKMEDAPKDRAEIENILNDHVTSDMQVSEEWITQADLDATPGLVNTLSVQPPRGAGRIRLVRIAKGGSTIDLQPCGGTHVARTGEIGALRIGKIEKKGRRNRRVYLHLDS